VGFANYKIVGSDGAWQVEHDGRPVRSYATKEAAFEAAVAAASLALREGHEVLVAAPGEPISDPSVLSAISQQNDVRKRHPLIDT